MAVRKTLFFMSLYVIIASDHLSDHTVLVSISQLEFWLILVWSILSVPVINTGFKTNLQQLYPMMSATQNY